MEPLTLVPGISLAAVKSVLVEDAGKAERGTLCLRRGTTARCGEFFKINGPSKQWHCSGEKGNCGCAHAEARLVITLLRARASNYAENSVPQPRLLLSTLSPCTACANLVVASGLFDEVIYLRDLAHDMRGVRILKAAGISVRRA